VGTHRRGYTQWNDEHRRIGKVAKLARAFPNQRRWDLFEAICGERVRAGDAAWAASLSPAERLAVADDLLTTIRAVRVAAGDWQAVDDRAWCETLAGRPQDEQDIRGLVAAQRDAIDWPACLDVAEKLGEAIDLDIAGRLRAVRAPNALQRGQLRSDNPGA